MQTITTLKFNTVTRVESFKTDNTPTIKNLYKLIQGQNPTTRNKVGDIKIVRRVLDCGLKNAMIFVLDAYESCDAQGF